MKRLHKRPITLTLMQVLVAGKSIKNKSRGRYWSLKNASLFLLIATLLIVIIFTTSAQAAATFTQKSYRFENIRGDFAGPKDDSFQDQTDAADTARTDVKIGERLYLRINIEASASTSAQFKLQFGSGGTLPGTWADVTSSSAISYADGLLGELGDLEELGQDIYYPKTNGTTTLDFSQGYFVRNGNTTPLIDMNRFSEVAFALDTTNATANTHYWFRLYNVTTGAILDTYTQYPNLTVVSTTNDQKKFSKNSLDAAPVNGDSSDLLPYRLDDEGYQNLASDDSTAFTAAQRTCLEVF